MKEFQAVRSLRLRYIVGLSAIALLVTSSWLSLQKVVEEQSAYAHILSIAGHQGSKAERIALFALSMAEASNQDDFNTYRAQLGRTINALRRDHRTLIEGDPEAGITPVMTPLLEIIYFDPASGLDTAVARFLSHAETVYETPFGELSQNSGSMIYVMLYGPHALQSLFDSAAAEYEAEGRRAVTFIQKLELGVWLAALAALVLEALLIFRPLEKRIAKSLAALRDKNVELEETIAEMLAARRDLRQSEDRFRDMAENVPGVMFRLVERTNGDRYYDYVSPHVLEFCGVSPDDVQQDWRALNLHPEDVDGFLETIRDASTGRTDWSFEGRIRAPDGSERWWRSVSKPIPMNDDETVFNGVMIDITQQKELEDQLRRLATTDPLTGAYNRRHFVTTAEDEMTRAQRHNHPLSVFMIDIDHFKKVNDTCGHAGGDEALRRTVDVIQMHLRCNDTLGRLGGEEFAVLMPETDLDGAVVLAERLRKVIADMHVIHEEDSFKITASFGVATNEDGETFADMLNAADQALYAAKEGGRNKVVTAEGLTGGGTVQKASLTMH